jgi:hypothetical protein
VTSELSYPRRQQKVIINRRPDPYVSKLNLPNLSQSIHNFTADFVGDVQLDHAHVRRAEHGILVVNHGEVAMALGSRWRLRMVSEEGSELWIKLR